MSRGLRNNNPGNIRMNKDHFQGEIKPSQDKEFKQFETIIFGYRAMFVTLGTYLSRGHNTIEKIIYVWAPDNENDTQAYINSVVRLSGIPKDRILTAQSGSDYIEIVAAMSRVENGELPNKTDIIEGFEKQNKITR